MITSVIFDFDGVLGLSRPMAWAAGCRILMAFGYQAQVATMREYRRVFGREAQENVAGSDGAETLREMHRLIMRAQAAEIPQHTALIDMIGALRCPVGIITALHFPKAGGAISGDAASGGAAAGGGDD